MITPGWAPSTPASHDPSVDTTFPFSYSFVSSPRYQTFPQASWAYQSSVISTGSPSSETASWTTRAVTPFAIRFVRRVTVTTTRCLAPAASVSRYTHRLPGGMGHQGLSILVVNDDGSSFTACEPLGRAHSAECPATAA